MDFVIARCGTLDSPRCPGFGGNALTASWPLPDPANFAGAPAETATMVSALYGGIQCRLKMFVNLPHGSIDRLAFKRRLDPLGDDARPPI